MKTCAIQYTSDIHLEDIVNPNKHLDVAEELVKHRPSCDGSVYLVIAGDLTPNRDTAAKFLGMLQAHYDRMFYVAGNHEYYHNWYYGYNGTNKHLKNIQEAITNLTVLQNECIELDKIYLLGTTMWTPVNNTHFSEMNDSKHIHNAPRKKLTPVTVRNWHTEAYSFLDEQLPLIQAVDVRSSTKTVKPYVVVTHHVPCLLLEGHSAYYAPCPELLERANYWIHGHDHIVTDKIIGGCRVVSNPRGYAHELGKLGYNPGAHILV